MSTIDFQSVIDGPRPSPGSVSGKRPYEGSSSESVASFVADSVSITQGSIISANVNNSILGPDGKRPAKSSVSTAGCRQRITVVCAECKRLKLKCDRRTPCGSCTKRDTIPRCIYSQAAADKVDVQSLNIRLSAVEGKLSGMSSSSSDPASFGAGPSSATVSSSVAKSSGGKARAILAVGSHGASVAVNLEGVAGLWVDHLGLNTSAMFSRTVPATVGELDLERWDANRATTRTGNSVTGGRGIELRPFATMPDEGLIGFMLETTKLFLIPSLISSHSSSTEKSEDVVPSSDGDNIDEGQEESNLVGVSPKLVCHAFPPANVRAELYARFEAAHLLAPSVNFFVFQSRIEEMCRWAEGEINGSNRGRRKEPPPIAVPTPVAAIATGLFEPPTLSFFAAAALGLALGAQYWLAERDMGPIDAKAGLSSASLTGSISASAALATTTTNIIDRSMPPPPPPVHRTGSSFDNSACASPVSPPTFPSTSGSAPAQTQPQSTRAPQMDPSLPGMLYRLAKLALGLALERAGYEAFDLDYMHAKCLQARYLLVSNRGLNEGGADALQGLSIGRRKRVEKRVPGKRKGSPQHAERHGGDTVMDDASEPEDPSVQANSIGSGKTKGKGKACARGPTLALAPEMVGVVSEAVGNARMMGLNHDPELTGRGKFSLYEAEMRRRLWWEIVSLDAFVAECLGESPFINDESATTEFPSDVDEESFGPDSANRPAPNIESLHGNIDFFVQRCRLADLGKTLRRKVAAFKELHREARPSETYDLLTTVKGKIAAWLTDLPDHLQLKDLPPPSPPESKVKSPSLKGASVSPPVRDQPAGNESPHVIAMRCILAILARDLFLSIYLPFTKNDGPVSGTKIDVNVTEAPKRFDFATSPQQLAALEMLEPAMFIVQAWRHLHGAMRYVRPGLFMSYHMSKTLFDAAVILGHVAIEQPLFTGRALASLRIACEMLGDPSVLTGRHSTSSADESNCLSNEAVRIIEELILKADARAADATVGGGFGMSTPPTVKRKHEEVESESSDLLYHFRFPFVGTGVMSAGPPATTSVGAGSGSPTSPLVDGGNSGDARTGESTARSGSSRSKAISAPEGAVAGDPRPAMTKHKTAHRHPTISVRNRKGKDSHRTRANSTTSQRSDASHMLPPANPHRQSNSASSQSLPPNQEPLRRMTSSEPPASLRGSSYPGPPLSTAGPGPPHYTTPDTGKNGSSSTSSRQQQTNSGEFVAAAYHDTSPFPGPSPSSYGPPFPFPPPQGPTVPVPSHVTFDSFAVGSSRQNQERMTIGGGEPSPFSYGSTMTNGMDRSVGMHQSANFEAMSSLPRPPSAAPQERPYSLNPVGSQAQGGGNQLLPPMPTLEQSLEPAHQLPHDYHGHSHSQVRLPASSDESMVSRQGCSSNAHVYPPWSYYQG